MGKAGVSYNIPLSRVGRTATLIPLVRVERAPLPTDTRYDVMTIWQDIPTTEIYYLASFNNGLANWQKFKTPGSGTFEFLTVTDLATIENLIVLQSTLLNNSVQIRGVGPGWTNSEYTILQGAVTTTGDTPTSVFTLGLGENEAVSIHAQVTGMKDDFSEACGGTLVYTARRAGGSAVQVGFPVTSIQTESTATFSADVDGDTLRVLVTGVTAQTWNWVATIKLQPLQSST